MTFKIGFPYWGLPFAPVTGPAVTEGVCRWGAEDLAPVPGPPGAERGHRDACALAAGRPRGALQEGSHGATCREGTGPWGGPGMRPQNHRVCPCSSWSAPSHSATEQTTMPSHHLRGWQDPTGGPRRLTASLPGRKVLGVTEQVERTAL